jgi:hypothetical protein
LNQHLHHRSAVWWVVRSWFEPSVCLNLLIVYHALSTVWSRSLGSWINPTSLIRLDGPGSVFPWAWAWIPAQIVSFFISCYFVWCSCFLHLFDSKNLLKKNTYKYYVFSIFFLINLWHCFTCWNWWKYVWWFFDWYLVFLLNLCEILLWFGHNTLTYDMSAWCVILWWICLWVCGCFTVLWIDLWISCFTSHVITLVYE